MNVYIINTKINHIKRYQIMTAAQTGFNHVYPGKMFSLNDAIKLCGKNGWTINAINEIWHCIDK